MMFGVAGLQQSASLVAGDVVSVPGRHLQLQIAMARADKGLTALRQRMVSMNLSMGELILALGAGIGALGSCCFALSATGGMASCTDTYYIVDRWTDLFDNNCASALLQVVLLCWCRCQRLLTWHRGQIHFDNSDCLI
jgi:hypothetical protein